MSGKFGCWTEEEDRLLIEYQAIYGNKWSLVSQHIPGRNGQQCAQRWRHKVNPNIIRDKWTPEEDSLLTKLVQELGVGKWASVARHLPGRTDQQCMGRWRRHLDPSIRKDAWTPEEDAQLEELYRELGPSWSCIAKSITNRTPQQCRGRWCILSGSGKHKGSSPAAHSETITEHAGGQCAQTLTTAGATRKAARAACAAKTSKKTSAGSESASPSSLAVEPVAKPSAPSRQTRRTRAPANCNSKREDLESTERVGLPQPEDQAAGDQSKQARGSGEAEPAAGDEPSASPRQKASGCRSPGVLVSTGSHRGRLLLGNRVVLFRRRRRTSTTKALSRRAARAVPVEAEELAPTDVVGELAAALLSPPPSQLALEDEAALLSGLLDEDDQDCCDCADVREAESAPSEVTKLAAGRSEPAKTSGRGAGHGDLLEELKGEAAALMVTRRTRSGRCYSVVGPSTSSASSQRRSATSKDASKRGQSGASSHTRVATAGVSSREGAEEVPPRAVPQHQPPAGAAADGQGQAAAAAPAGNLAAQAAVQLPAIAEEPDEQDAASVGSARSSFGLPDHLFGLGQESPSGDQPLGWQELVNSPPTSSLLAMLEAGLLMTPNGTAGASPGAEALCAPVPPGLPKVEPGLSTGWSDVPALSWSDWRNRHGGFGIAVRPPTPSAHGTPDNTRPVTRATQDAAGPSLTPSRDMYVRVGHNGHPGASARLCHQAQAAPLLQHNPEGQLEGHGATGSQFDSPSAAAFPGLQFEAQTMVAGPSSIAAVRGAVPPSAAACTPQPDAAAGCPQGQGLHVPDCCSPSRQPRMPLGYAAHAPHRLALGAIDTNIAAGTAVHSASVRTQAHASARPSDFGPGQGTGVLTTAPTQLAKPPAARAIEVAASTSTMMMSLHGRSLAPVAALPYHAGNQAYSLPPALQCALPPAPAAYVGAAGGAFPRHYPPAQPYPYHAHPAAGVCVNSACQPPATGGFAQGAPVAGVYGGHASLPSGTLPRLALPKLAAPDPKQHRVTSLFPVLTLASYQPNK